NGAMGVRSSFESLAGRRAITRPRRCGGRRRRVPRSGRTLRKIRETEFVVGRLTSRRINLTVPRMPLYAYRCTSCGASEEHLQKFSDAPVETCQACGGPLTRLISRTAFQLKGGG